MRRTLLLLAATIVLALTAAPSAFAQANDQNCADFPSQAAAQVHLEADPSDPDNLDADDDGQACESFDYGDGNGGAPPSAADDGSLPFTGPGDRQLPIGAALVTTGLALVVATQRRYRARHVRR
jgi:Excalibur calcium-binding domain